MSAIDWQSLILSARRKVSPDPALLSPFSSDARTDNSNTSLVSLQNACSTLRRR